MNMEQAELESRALELAIARRIRKHRKRNQWTLEHLAKVTGLSKGHLSQIENGEKVPPISTLSKIAFALGTTIAELISGQAPVQYSAKINMGSIDDCIPITHTEASPAMFYESFGFTKQDRIMDSYVLTLGPEFPPNPLMHSGQEFVYSIKGHHEFYYDGQIYPMKPGDVIYFDSDRPHMGRTVGDEPAKLLVVYCNASQK